MELQPSARSLQTELLAKDAVLFTLQRELSSLRSSVAKFRQEKAENEAREAREKAEIEQLKKDKASLVSALQAALNDEKSEKEKELKEAKEHLRAKQAEVDELKKRREEAADALTKERKVKNAALARLKEEKREATALIERLSKENILILNKSVRLQTLKAMRTELDEKDQEIAKLKSDRDEIVSALRSELEAKNGEIKALQADRQLVLQAIQSDENTMLQALQKKMKATQNALTMQRKEMQAKDTLISELQSRVDVLDAKAVELAKDKDAAVRALESGLGEKYAEIDRLKQDKEIAVRALKDKNEELEKMATSSANKGQPGANVELEVLQRELNVSRTTISKLLQEVQAKSKAISSLESLNRNVNADTKEKEQYANALKEMNKIIDQLKEEKGIAYRALKDTGRELDRVKKSKREKIKDLHTMRRDLEKAKNSVIKSLRAEQADLRAELASVVAERQKLMDALRAQDSSHQELQAKLTQDLGERDNARTEWDMLSYSVQRNDSSSFRYVIQSLKSELDKATVEHRQEVEYLTNELAKARQINPQIEAPKKASDALASMWESTIKSKDDEITELKEEIRNKVVEFVQIKKHLEAKTHEVSAQQGRLNEVEAMLGLLQDGHNLLEIELNSVRTERDESLAVVKKAANELGKLWNTCLKLHAEQSTSPCKKEAMQWRTAVSLLQKVLEDTIAKQEVRATVLKKANQTAELELSSAVPVFNQARDSHAAECDRTTRQSKRAKTDLLATGEDSRSKSKKDEDQAADEVTERLTRSQTRANRGKKRVHRSI